MQIFKWSLIKSQETFIYLIISLNILFDDYNCALNNLADYRIEELKLLPLPS